MLRFVELLRSDRVMLWRGAAALLLLTLTPVVARAADVNGDAAYVEFTGLFVRASDNRSFPFRVMFGSVSAGSGSVLPMVCPKHGC